LRVFTASGELDRTDLPYVRSALSKAFASGERAVVLDMSEVTYIDSSVLAGLIAESLDADRRGATLAIVTGTAGILRSLELKGLIQVMHISETLEAATADLPAH
jgi:anti-sigma B factor antagonist